MAYLPTFSWFTLISTHLGSIIPYIYPKQPGFFDCSYVSSMFASLFIPWNPWRIEVGCAGLHP